MGDDDGDGGDDDDDDSGRGTEAVEGVRTEV